MAPFSRRLTTETANLPVYDGFKLPNYSPSNPHPPESPESPESSEGTSSHPGELPPVYHEEPQEIHETNESSHTTVEMDITDAREPEPEHVPQNPSV